MIQPEEHLCALTMESCFPSFLLRKKNWEQRKFWIINDAYGRSNIDFIKAYGNDRFCEPKSAQERGKARDARQRELVKLRGSNYSGSSTTIRHQQAMSPSFFIHQFSLGVY